MNRPFHSQIKMTFTAFLCLWLSGVMFILCFNFLDSGEEANACHRAKIAHAESCLREKPPAKFQTQYADCMQECGILSAIFSGSQRADHFPVLDLAVSRTVAVAASVETKQLDQQPTNFVEIHSARSSQKPYLLNRNFRL